MSTDPLIYIRKLENELAEAKKRDDLERPTGAGMPPRRNFLFENVMKHLRKWVHSNAPHRKA
jgi:hypothetical protein